MLSDESVHDFVDSVRGDFDDVDRRIDVWFRDLDGFT